MNRRANKDFRSGYVLLMTLALLVLATTLLVAVGRSAVQHALEAHQEQELLQRKWGLISCRHAVLPFAESILASSEQVENRPIPQKLVVVRLGEDVFTLQIADEQAKANVNEMLQRSTQSTVEDRIREMLSDSGLGNHVRLRPSTLAVIVPVSVNAAAGAAPEPQPPISGPGQIFDELGPAQLFQRPDETTPLECLTCWGDGGINLMRAEAPALRLALMPSLTRLQIGRLIQARNQNMAIPVAAHPTAAPAKSTGDVVSSLLSQARIDVKDRAKLPLTSRSTCHSLWIVVKDRQRLWYNLSVSDESNPRQSKFESFVW